jgi:phage gpG-like protein
MAAVGTITGNPTTAALNAVGLYLRGKVQRTFNDQRDPFGRPWKPLKHREGLALLDTGRLRASITHRVTGSVVEVGTNVPYAGFHNAGTKHIPARTFLALSPEWVEGCVRVAVDVLLKRV